MNRFEIIYETIGSLERDREEVNILHDLRVSVDLVRMDLQDMAEDIGGANEEIKRHLSSMLWHLISLGSKRDYCGACICSDLEDMVRNVSEGMRITVLPPRVINVDNVPKGSVIVPESPESVPGNYISGTDVIPEEGKIISDRAAGIRNYRVDCDVVSFNGVGTDIMQDVIEYVSMFRVPGELCAEEWVNMLLEDLKLSTGVEWESYRDVGYQLFKTKNKLERIVLRTKLLLSAPKIRLL